jgi:hypothetical protein
MELDLHGVEVRVQEEVSAEEVAAVAGWEVIVLAPGPMGNVSALIVEQAYHIKQAIPAIT